MLLKAEVAGAGNYHVVKYFYAQQAAGIAQALGYIFVFVARFQAAGRVVVRNYYVRCNVLNCRFKYFARMD